MIDLLRQHPFFRDKKLDSCTLLENQGYCNENYLLVADNQKFIARKLIRTDIDRSFEYKVQQLAFEKGITAETLLFDEENDFMIFEFLEGIHKSKLEKKDLKHIAGTLHMLHSIKVDSVPMELYIENKTDETRNAFECIANYPNELVFCHNDLNPKNIFFTDEVKFIDFEYAGVNDKYFDLACICVEFGLDEKMQDIFLNAYFENEKREDKKVEAYKTIYIALCKQWFENN